MSRRNSDEGEGDADASPSAGAVPRRQRRGVSSEEAIAAATAHRDAMVAAMERERPKRAWKDLLPSEQVVQLEPDELWPTVAAQWGRPGAELITSFADAWEGQELAAVVLHLGLEVTPRSGRRDYWERALRRQVVAAVRAYAADHPELFADAEAELAPGPPQQQAPPPGRAAPDAAAVVSPPRTPPQAGSASASRAPPQESPNRGRRSPRGSAASRSADAMRALGQLPLVDRALERAERPSPERKESRPQASHARPSRRAPAASLPRVDLLRYAAEDDDDPDDSSFSSPSDSEDDGNDRDWAQDSDDAAAATSARRGGRLRRDEFDSRLAETGVHRRSFAKGFLRNALAAAGGRTLSQLFKELTAQWNASVHCTREALAHARTLDLLLLLPRNMRGVDEVLEHVCRRLGGVQTAATSGSWEMCDRLESETSVKNFVPDYFMSTALKQVTREQAVRKSAAEGLNAGKRPSSQGTGRKPRGGNSSGNTGRSNGAHGPGGPTSGASFPPTSTQSGGSKAGSRKK
jgi:hypothetical protein